MTRVVIIGAGFGGIAAAAAIVRDDDIDLVVLEKADRVGGVWRDNTYPGCACDIPAPLYSYSFAMNPNWTRRFPPHREIQAYIEDCAARLGITERIRFGTEVTDATWTGAHWVITMNGGETLEADVLIPAVGQLSRPAIPSLPGAETFQGTAVHTAHWTPDVPISGKRIAVIGTGASAIQLVPAIAGDAAHVSVFQRTPPWTLPKPDRRYGRARLSAYRKWPSLMRASRAGTWLLTLVTGAAVTGNRVADALVRGISHLQRRVQVRDPELRAKVTPDEPMGCKRVLFTNAWLPALARPDVDLITEKIVAVTENGIRTADGADHPCDVLVYGTGFAATEFLVPIRVTGRDGVLLSEVWREGAHAYLGITVPGFPNLFLVYGPNTNTGNTSVIYFHETQARYIAQAVRRVALGDRPFEVRTERATDYDQEMQTRLAGSVWTGCQSWYRTATGRVVTNWPGKAQEYRRRAARLDPADFR
ncbi:cation diffusion facilitator CzcD-associated flavoprotein CzcO [Actinoplanes lutulentus]|uniref:Cation diffusion facilitator CzcD-associated flavoprotein CzcO n=1 Tax=Actinoplanes lutulentus TaxID=1287878 RepID=A0A327ZJ57_9ACTN|nr:NAD(P)/FAD-dependent oxidoreductase [Actinoplanes lutulentus]MBB2944317.1 cation diffusion facilitator CzcD-associated flavoprotein CzcO [Actinoplanes lutulentus]RAK42450.1 cation diffusion facilitator CzcD-associated flavoprotein CzcO [Actinoplanes lutulentus]